MLGNKRATRNRVEFFTGCMTLGKSFGLLENLFSL